MDDGDSCGDRTGVLSEQGRHHILDGDAAKETVMGVKQQRLEQGLRLLATHLPDGSDGDGRWCQWRGEAGQAQERGRHEHQTPLFLNSFGAAQAIHVQAQVSLPVLIKGFRWPPGRGVSPAQGQGGTHGLGRGDRGGRRAAAARRLCSRRAGLAARGARGAGAPRDLGPAILRVGREGAGALASGGRLAALGHADPITVRHRGARQHQARDARGRLQGLPHRDLRPRGAAPDHNRAHHTGHDCRRDPAGPDPPLPGPERPAPRPAPRRRGLRGRGAGGDEPAGAGGDGGGTSPRRPLLAGAGGGGVRGRLLRTRLGGAAGHLPRRPHERDMAAHPRSARPRHHQHRLRAGHLRGRLGAPVLQTLGRRAALAHRPPAGGT